MHMDLVPLMPPSAKSQCISRFSFQSNHWRQDFFQGSNSEFFQVVTGSIFPGGAVHGEISLY